MQMTAGGPPPPPSAGSAADGVPAGFQSRQDEEDFASALAFVLGEFGSSGARIGQAAGSGLGSVAMGAGRMGAQGVVSGAQMTAQGVDIGIGAVGAGVGKPLLLAQASASSFQPPLRPHSIGRRCCGTRPKAKEHQDQRQQGGCWGRERRREERERCSAHPRRSSTCQVYCSWYWTSLNRDFRVCEFSVKYAYDFGGGGDLASGVMAKSRSGLGVSLPPVCTPSSKQSDWPALTH